MPHPLLNWQRPALAARYRVLWTPVDARRHQPAPTEWHYQRDDWQVRRFAQGAETVWTRLPQGGLRVERFFHDAVQDAARKAASRDAEPQPLDDSAADWPSVSAFVGVADLHHLQPDTPRAGRAAPHEFAYTSASDRVVDLLWHREWQLPLRMTRLHADYTLSCTLLQTEPSPPRHAAVTPLS